MAKPPFCIETSRSARESQDEREARRTKGGLVQSSEIRNPGTHVSNESDDQVIVIVPADMGDVDACTFERATAVATNARTTKLEGETTRMSS
ncbi:hypothetical protein B0H10DRAFT_2045120, partial [Mycena sp. CBHHK59/15]